MRRGRSLPLPTVSTPMTTEPLTRPSLAAFRNRMFFIRSRESHKPRLLFSTPRERGRDSQPSVPSFVLTVLPRALGPGFPGARAGSPLSRTATSPLRHASRHPFVIPVFQRVAFPRRRALIGVRESLGPRARFRALCLTPRFFGPRCRQTNSANLTTRRTSTLIERMPSPASTCVDTFQPNIGHPKGLLRAT